MTHALKQGTCGVCVLSPRSIPINVISGKVRDRKAGIPTFVLLASYFLTDRSHGDLPPHPSPPSEERPTAGGDR